MMNNTPKMAVVYYSKTGHSQRVAERLALVLDTDLFDINTRRYRFPFLCYMRAGFDSLRRAPAPLEHPLPDIKHHDAVVICGPVWTSYPAVPIRSYLQQQTGLPDVVGLMLTNGDHSPPQKAYAAAEAELGRPLDAKGAIANSIEGQPEAETQINAFASTIRDALGKV